MRPDIIHSLLKLCQILYLFITVVLICDNSIRHAVIGMIIEPAFFLLSADLPSVTIYSVDCNSVNVTTTKVDIIGGKFHGFDLFMQKVGVNASLPWIRLVSLTIEAQAHMVSRLEPNTQYSFRMCGKISTTEL